VSGSQRLRTPRPSPTRLREILRHAERRRLVRFTEAEAFPRSEIEIRATIKLVLRFEDISDWRAAVDRALGEESLETPPTKPAGDEPDGEGDDP
jgi:hypothetical protein